MDKALNQQHLADLKHWFHGYVDQFCDSEAGFGPAMALKREHTERVCTEISGLGRALGLAEQDLCLAVLTALFHDIGRFEQYARFGTFVDRRSQDHAALGVSILRQNAVLAPFEAATRHLVERVIAYHNRAGLPAHESPRCLFFAKLLRDADKLDILKILCDYYHRDQGARNGALELDLPDTPGFSQAVCRDLRHQRMVEIKQVKNLNDFKLLQIGWVFDVNFKPTFMRIQSRGYLDRIAAALPGGEPLESLIEQVGRYLASRIEV